LTSPYVRPDLAAFEELEKLLGHLAEELSAWRRRCLKAEAELQTVKAQGGMVPGEEVTKTRSRQLELERENLELRARVERAREMVIGLHQRLVFLEGEYDAGSGT
jgi:hypothetical protein